MDNVMSDAQEELFASVLIDRKLDRPLDYSIPAALKEKIGIGSRVVVSVRKKNCFATVIAIKKIASFPTILPIDGLATEKTLITPELFQLAEWVSKYYLCPLRKVLKTLLPPSVRNLKKDKAVLIIKPLVSLEKLKDLAASLRKEHTAQAEVIDLLMEEPKGVLLSEIIKKLCCSTSPIRSLERKKIVECSLLPMQDSVRDFEYFLTPSKRLGLEQQAAFTQISKHLTKGGFNVFLLYGVTGSGKTEIYLQVMQQTLKSGKSVLFLVPEISLASQTIERIKSRFDVPIVMLHHRLSHAERKHSWQRVADGTARIVVGARSAVFAPLDNIGLIIVDEEHEGAYKQMDDSPCYHARDVAIMRAKFSLSTVILGSATPSIESFYNAEQGKYTLLTLKERASSALLPKVSIVDMQKEFEKARGFTLFSEKLLEAIKERLKVGEQVLLFLNRRGYHSAQICSVCGYHLRCDHCDISLTYHLGENILACHHCGLKKEPLSSCPACNSSEGLRFKGAGTELVEKTLHAIFPQVRTLRLDADTTKKKGSQEAIFRAFRSGKADVLIGTQMIAKGLHFPSLTLSAILYAESSLSVPDFRAEERCFQMLLQVSGRSGRGEIPGEVIIQTHLPHHSAILSAKEISHRELFFFPPFSRLIKIMVSGKNGKRAEVYGSDLRKKLLETLPKSFTIQPLTPSGHTKLKDHFRFQFLIKASAMKSFHSYLESIDKSLPIPAGVERKVDVDPFQTFL
jgi:primosomal protein N' (replication factor Y) (superfamily II helicase)